MNPLFRALQFYRADALKIAFALALLLVSTGASLLKPWPLALIVDSVLSGKPLPSALGSLDQWKKPTLMAFLVVALWLFQAGHGALSALQTFTSIQIGLRGLARVRNKLFQRLQRLSLRFHQGSHQGDVIYRASWDTYAFQTLFQQGLFTLFQASLALVLMVIVMWQLNEKLTIALLAVIPVLVLAMKFFGNEMKRRSLAAHQSDSQVTTLFQQSIVALPLIQSYTREETEQRRFAEKAAESFSKRTAQHGWEVLYWLAMALVFGAGTAMITWLGAREVLGGRLTTGELLIFVAYLAQLYEPLNQLSHLGATISDASAGTQRVFEILDAKDEVKDSPNARPITRAEAIHEGQSVATNSETPKPETSPERDLTPARQTEPAWHPLQLRGNIAFDNVSFGYEKNRLVLQGVSFSLSAGEAAAIIGPSGAGKTTLLQLLPRFYDPTAGAVRLEGVDVRELRLKDLREQVSFVLQEPILLSASISENIAYGKPNASLDEIKAAAAAAHAAEFIEQLPNKYETHVGEGGARLSVGEKQRINLARAFLKDAPILALDEPTSALDSESAALVAASLTKLIQRRTTLIVAHRLSTIQHIDKILVLERGRLVECGSSAELLRSGGYYARLTDAHQTETQKF